MCRSWVLLVMVGMMIGTLSGQAATNETPNAVLFLRSDRRTFHVGDRITFEYRIENNGQSPFYINSAMHQVEGFDAGIRVKLFDERDQRVMLGQIVGEEAAPTYKSMPDLPQFIEEHWLLLRPDMFYGMKSYYPTLKQIRPGKYRLHLTDFGNILSQISSSQAAELDRRLTHPFISGTVESNDVWIHVSE
jgi:hypothetical protein